MPILINTNRDPNFFFRDYFGLSGRHDLVDWWQYFFLRQAR